MSEGETVPFEEGGSQMRLYNQMHAETEEIPKDMWLGWKDLQQ